MYILVHSIIFIQVQQVSYWLDSFHLLIYFRALFCLFCSLSLYVMLIIDWLTAFTEMPGILTYIFLLLIEQGLFSGLCGGGRFVCGSHRLKIVMHYESVYPLLWQIFLTFGQSTCCQQLSRQLCRIQVQMEWLS